MRFLNFLLWLHELVTVVVTILSHCNGLWLQPRPHGAMGVHGRTLPPPSPPPPPSHFSLTVELLPWSMLGPPTLLLRAHSWSTGLQVEGQQCIVVLIRDGNIAMVPSWIKKHKLSCVQLLKRFFRSGILGYFLGVLGLQGSGCILEYHSRCNTGAVSK